MSAAEINQRYWRDSQFVLSPARTREELAAIIRDIRASLKRRRINATTIGLPRVSLTARVRLSLLRAYIIDYYSYVKNSALKALPTEVFQLTTADWDNIFNFLNTLGVDEQKVDTAVPIEFDNIADDYFVANAGNEMHHVDPITFMPIPKWSPVWEEQILNNLVERLVHLVDETEGPYISVRTKFVDINKEKPIYESMPYRRLYSDDITEFTNEVYQFIYKYVDGSLRGIVDEHGTDLRYLEKVEVLSRPNLQTRATIRRVAKRVNENCVISILRSIVGDETIDKIYDKYPVLQPTILDREDHFELVESFVPFPHDVINFDDIDFDEIPEWPGIDDNIYVNEAQLEDIAKIANVQIRAYTRLGLAFGAKLENRWIGVGNKGRRAISIMIRNEHATIIPEKMKIEKITYHDNYLVLPETSTTLVDYKRCGEGSPYANFFTQLEGDKLVMHKVFRPSSVYPDATEEVKDELDTNIKLAHIFDVPQMLYYDFKRVFNMVPIPEYNLRAVVRRAEHFIGRRAMIPMITTNTYSEIDRNRHYCAYETMPDYIGFPTNALTTCLPEHSVSPAFYIINSITFSDASIERAFTEFHNYIPGQQIVLAQPTYAFISQYAVIDIAYVLEGKFERISIIDFANQYNISEEKKKMFGNTLIGRTITGGITERTVLKVEFGNIDERDQLIFEAQRANLSFGGDTESASGELTIIMSAKPRGFFNFHAYILSYANIAMMRKWRELETNNYTIAAYNVDAIVVCGNYTGEVSKTIGDWKLGEVKPHYFSLSADRAPVVEEPPLPILTVPKRKPIVRNTVVGGAAGLGKSYFVKVDPQHDQIMLAPTHPLRIEHSELHPNTHTAQKALQFHIKKDEQFEIVRTTGAIPPAHSATVIDEGGMFTTEQWDMMDRRLGSSIKIVTIDFEQICNEIDGTRVTRKYFEDRGYDFIEMKREPGMHARQEYAYGCELDKLRGLSYKQQCEFIRASHLWDRILYDDIFADIDIERTKIIVGNHQRAFDINKRVYNICMRQHAANSFKNGLEPYVPCVSTNKVTINKPRKYELIPYNNKKIFWGRTSMNTERPTGKTWEPYVAVTSDAYQGKTAPDDIKLIVDMGSLCRHGTLYTAMTRTRKPDNMAIIDYYRQPSKRTIAAAKIARAEAEQLVVIPPEPALAQIIIDLTDNIAQFDDDMEALINEIGDYQPLVEPYEPREPIISTTFAEPEVFAKLDEVHAKNADGAIDGLLIHTEYPYRHFLLFTDSNHFASWSAAQEPSARCYHEVVTTDNRCFVVDIDGQVDEADATKFTANYVDAFKKLFAHLFEIECADNDIAVIESSGFSKTKGAYKYSLQIRTRFMWSNAATCELFAKLLNERLGQHGANIDRGVYKSIQNFRCLGSTKKDDARWSRSTAGADDCWVGYQLDELMGIIPIAHRSAPKPLEIIDGSYADQIRIAAAPYTSDHIMKYNKGRYIFTRAQSGECAVCHRRHDNSDMFIKRVGLDIFLCCFGGSTGYNARNNIKLFTIANEEVAAPTNIEDNFC